MLDNIKSQYFIKYVFYHIDEKIKLKIANYNKRLQNILEINIINYKVFSGKYIIYETKERRKIYNVFTDRIIFDGEFIKGKAKAYDNYGELMYDGEYLNGKRHGKGKVYHSDGKLLYEGEYLNGKKWNI